MQQTRLTTHQKPTQGPRPVPEQDMSQSKRPRQPSKPGFQRAFMPGMDHLESQQISHRRRTILQDIMRMAKSDVRISRMLYKLGSDATHKTYSIEIQEAPSKRIERQAKQIIERTEHLCKIKRKLQGWTRSLLRDGDLFLQLMVDGVSMEIVEANKLAAEITHSRMNAEGKFPENKSPYFQSTIYDPALETRTFEEWEIVHLKWNEEDGHPYGQPLFESARLSQKRTESGEQDVSMRRKLMAAMRYVFNIGTAENPATWEEVEKFKEENADSLDNPLNPVGHFYLNGLGQIDTLKGDEQIGEMSDVEFHEGLLFMAGLTNSSLMSGGREAATNMNVVGHQNEDYHRSLVNIDDTLEHQGLRIIFDRSMILQGVNPESIVYTLNWSAKDNDTIDDKILRGAMLIEMGFSHQTAYSVIDLDNDMTYEEEVNRIKEQIEQGIIPYGGPTLGTHTRSRINPASPQQQMQQQSQKQGDM